MQVGDVVKWWEFYAEGDIVRDAGYGVVIETASENNYKILKSTGHISVFSDYSLDLMEDINER